MRIDTFREMYDAELAEAASFEAMMSRALPKLAEKTSNAGLREALSAHAAGPQTQDQRLDQILRQHGQSSGEHTDQSMEAMVAEAQKMAEMVPAGPLRDAAIIASVQRLKHYEVAVYGTLANYADCLNLQEEKQALGAILQQEKAFDETLTRIAKDEVNPQAAA